MRERFFPATNFLTQNAPKFSPKFLSLCGSERIPGKFPPNFPLNFPNFPAKNQKTFTDELLQERREKNEAAPNSFSSKIIYNVQMDAAVLGDRLPEVTQSLSSAQAASLCSSGIGRARKCLQG